MRGGTAGSPFRVRRRKIPQIFDFAGAFGFNLRRVATGIGGSVAIANYC
jgi:hypothetical protein